MHIARVVFQLALEIPVKLLDAILHGQPVFRVASNQMLNVFFVLQFLKEVRLGVSGGRVMVDLPGDDEAKARLSIPQRF